MNFKVGDKVRILNGKKLVGNERFRVTTGKVYEVISFHEKNELEVEHIKVIDNFDMPFAICRWEYKYIELVEPKKTKNQRITALEKEVAELKIIVEGMRKPRFLNAQEGIELGEAIAGGLADGLNNIIEFEGAKYRKVEREAREGDVVIFRKNTSRVSSINKPYKAFNHLGRLSFVGDIGNTYKLYVDGFGRTRETVDVYELIKQELTPNQQRAQIIEKAKKFVEVKSECVKDSTCVEGGYSRKKIENPNYDHLAAEKVEFIINQEKHTVVSLVKFNDGSIMTKGIAKCNPSDVFNVHIGKAIALGRALRLDVSEFEQAVQPDEVVVGQIVVGNNSGKTYEVQEFHDRVKLGGEFGRSIAINGLSSSLWIGTKQVTIINDTNAQYEEVK